MDMSVVEQELPGTTPEYTEEAEYLAGNICVSFSASELEKMLKISPKLAAENYERYQRFGSLSNSRKQALFAYNGSVFKAIDPNSFFFRGLEVCSRSCPDYLNALWFGASVGFDSGLPDRIFREVGWGEPVRLLGSEADNSIIGRCA